VVREQGDQELAHDSVVVDNENMRGWRGCGHGRHQTIPLRAGAERGLLAGGRYGIRGMGLLLDNAGDGERGGRVRPAARDANDEPQIQD
jgi:hypothetical protein